MAQCWSADRADPCTRRTVDKRDSRPRAIFMVTLVERCVLAYFLLDPYIRMLKVSVTRTVLDALASVCHLSNCIEIFFFVVNFLFLFQTDLQKRVLAF